MRNGAEPGPAPARDDGSPKGVDSLVSGVSVHIAHRDIYSLIRASAAASPTAIAVEAHGFFDLTYAGLHRRVQQVMMFLRRNMEVQRGDVVAVVLPNGPEMSVMLLAVSSVAACAPLNPAYTRQEFEDCFARLGVKFVVVPQGQESAAVVAARKSGVGIIGIPVRLPTDKVLKFLRTVFKQPCPTRENVPPEQEPFDEALFESTPSVTPQSDDLALVLQTSGTTSRPKTVPLTHANICTAVYMIRDSLRLGATDRCLSMLPQFHIGGLVDLLLVPLAAGGRTICAGDFTTQKFFHMLNECRPTWYQAAPATLHDLMAHVRETGRATSPSSLKFIRSVSAPLQPSLMNELESALGVPVIEMYGMTEAGPMICSNLPPPGGRRAGSVGRPYVEKLAVVDERGEVVARGEKGEVVIRGANVIKAYADDGEANEQAFRSGWFHTGDLGRLDAEGYLYLDGRVKEIINRGGEKISPLEVDEALLSHPAVAQAVTFPVPHPALGENLAAAVVLHPNARAGERELQAHVASQLAEFKVPYRVRIVDEIPKGPTGKVPRLKLAELINVGGESEYVAPRNAAESRLAEVWAKVLKVERVGVRDDFFELGGFSLLGVELIGEVERAFGCTIPEQALFNLSTVESMAEDLGLAARQGQIDSGQPAYGADELSGELLDLFKRVIRSSTMESLGPDSLMLVMNRDGTHEPLYWCFNAPDREMPGLGHGLGRDYPLYGMYSGGQVCEYTHTNTRAIANIYTREILALQTEGPYLIGGNCRGGAVALEIVLNLLKMGKTGVRLCVLEFFHPDLFDSPAELTLMYGRESPDQLHKRFALGEPDWADRFVTRPTVHMLDGEYGIYWHGERARMLASVVSRFIDHTLTEEIA